MSKLTLRGEIMLHYAAMLHMNCKAGSCRQCPFVTDRGFCSLTNLNPIDWAEILERIRKEAADGTQEDNR